MENKIVSSAEGSIKRISLKILLVLYVLQREKGVNNDVISFDNKMADKGGLQNETGKKY